MDSDTESESQVSVGGWDAVEFAHIATTQALRSSQDGSQDAMTSSADVEQAIQDLRSLDLETVQKDESLHDVIQVASATILSYLEHIVVSLTPEDLDNCSTVSAMSALLSPDFIALLFAYRQIFHAIAARDVHAGTVASAVICWVDVVLAKLGQAVTAVAPGVPSAAGQLEHVQSSMQKQLDCHLLRAATQLPSAWIALPSVLSAAHTSPAACRLALRLLYGIYILRPHLQGDRSSPPASSVDRDKLFAALRSYLGRAHAVSCTTSTQSLNSAGDLGMQERVTYAMFLSLFAAMELPELSPFRPSTDTALLRHVIAVMCPGTVLSSDAKLMTPRLSLDTAQLIFLRRPETIAWCWRLWSDQRIAHAEIIDHLTATWLYHVGGPFEHDGPSCDIQHWGDDVLIAIEAGPTTACATLMRFIKRGLSAMSDQELASATLDAVYRAVYSCAAYLLSDDELHESSVIQGLCATLQTLFSHLRQNDVAVATKDAILEGLILVRIDTLRIATEETFGPGSDLRIKLEQDISAFARTIADESARERLEDAGLSDLRRLLNYLTVVWHCRAQLDDFGQMTAPLLHSLVDWLSAGDSSHDILKALRTSCILILSVARGIGGVGPEKLWTDEAVWEIALAEGDPADLILVSALAGYVRVTHNHYGHLSPLIYAHCWDYLRDALLLILTHHFLDVEEPLALLVAPSICMALVCLIASADHKAVAYILSSPWTMNLCLALKVLSQLTKRQGQGIYHDHLWRRLSPFAAQLLLKLNNIVSTEVTAPIEIPAGFIGETKLISVRLHGISHFLLVHA